jgi:hypothetical protein
MLGVSNFIIAAGLFLPHADVVLEATLIYLLWISITYFISLLKQEQVVGQSSAADRRNALRLCRLKWKGHTALDLQLECGRFATGRIYHGRQRAEGEHELGPIRRNDRNLDVRHVLPDVSARLLARPCDVQLEPADRLPGGHDF